MATIPFSDSAQATSDVSGNVTFTRFLQPRMLEWRQGSFSVVRSDGKVVAPTTVLPITWKAYVGATIWGTWYNDQPSLMVQTNGPPVKVTGVNLAPSTAYQCIYTGYDSDNPPPLAPLPAPAPPPSAPQTLVSNNVSLGVTPIQIGSVQPVVVGTSLEIFECLTAHQGGSSNVRLAIQWSIDGSFVDPIEYDFDLADAVNMRGLVLPNLAPFVRFLATAPSGGEQISLTVFTGLATIVRPPIVAPGTVLVSSTGPFATGSTPFAVPPYVGNAMLSGEMVGAATKFELGLAAMSYLNLSAGSQFVVDSMADPNGVRIIPPTQVFVPSYICTVNVVNGNGVPENGDFQLVALGP